MTTQDSSVPQTLLQGKPYVHSRYGVNVQDTWRRFGWQPSQPAVPQGSEPTYQQNGSQHELA